VEKKQSELCLEILRRFNKNNILNDFILIGSWAAYFYKDYFSDIAYMAQATIKTRDIDFLIENPRNIEEEINIPELLKDLGFITVFKGSKGYIKLDHPDLILEFLVPERGKGIDKPYPLPKLGINAVTLRFLSFLSINTIKVRVENFHVTLPHPANFALHKLIIFQRRIREEKAIKDRNMAIGILNALIEKGDLRTIKKVYGSIPRKWQRRIVDNLKSIKEQGIIDVLSAPKEMFR
jgi:hypothetical protein